MALRSGGRKLSFDILSSDGSFDDETFLYRSVSDLSQENGGDGERLASPDKPNRRKRKNKGSRKKKMIAFSIEEDPITDKDDNGSCSKGLESDSQSYMIQTTICEEVTVPEDKGESVRTVLQITESDFQNLHSDRPQFLELRQRNVNGSGACDEPAKEENGMELNSSGKGLHLPEPNGTVITKLGTAKSLDWKRIVAEDSSYLSSIKKSPVKYFMEEMFGGNSLRSTTTPGNEKERERVYDTIFRLPWRCELLIDVGFFVCVDSFLSLLTIMPTRILMTFWRFLNIRQFQRPFAEELSDFGCFIVLACGVTLLQQIDSVERFHISAFILFVLAQNILEAEGPWFESFLYNALLVYVCEMIIDIIKHSFLAKFNDIKPIVYSEFLEDLCKQTLNIQPEDEKKNLTFIPLAPACVVIRVLAPVYAAHLPYGPLPWRLLWIFLLSAMTYIMLASLKVMIGMGLQKHAT
ncbi:hypothetical protein HHK36_030168 [Tetracentron sinense]|uniref:Uncharacterized protein n=1 Tax=Tetracentron sinense TaxID=13715 RepID=A0A834YG17_TETSI|nr:hypothetical protein HHK36_030168 [Tetracentron sinense]